MAVSTILALLLTNQLPTPSQSPAPSPGGSPVAAAGFQASGQAFASCIQTKITAVPAALTPEQGADHVLAACKAEQTAIEQAVETMIASAPTDQQAAARKQLTDSMAVGRTQIAQGIGRMRRTTNTLPSPPRPQ